MRRFFVALTSAALLAGCGVEARRGLAAQCDRNGDCDAPLVCRLAFCRNACRTARDCIAGQSCVLDERGFGACQLPDETSCSLDSDCPSPLVCRFSRCVNECVDEGSGRDCPPGAVCRRDGEGLGCVDEADDACQSNRDCAGRGPDGGDLVCASDGRCRVQCILDRDCGGGTVCAAGRCVFPARPDAGAPDGGAPPPDGGGGLPPLGDVWAIAAGALHTCAAVGPSEPAQLRCWGDDGNGRLGRGTISAAPVPLPGPVGGFVGALPAIGAGRAHSCRARALGSVDCWGSNESGAIGISTIGDFPSPRAVFGVDAVRGLALGTQFGCAIQEDLPVRCWGRNDQGQLGGSPSSFSVMPVDSAVPADPDRLVAGDAHHCALAAGEVTCLGADADGQLGAAGPAVTDAIDVAAGAAHSCLVRAGGEVLCWGAGDRGQLGLGGTDGATTRTVVPGVPAASRVFAGARHTCALTSAGEVWCWGANDDGQAAPGVGGDVLSPRRIDGLDGATELALGDRHGCARIGDAPSGDLRCWGANDRGQLGVGDTAPRVGVERVRSAR